MHILKIILIIIEVVLIFNIMIIVHELGHFLAARWRGLVIEKFGVWFGKPIWKKKINGVEYSLGSIPAGGFVALPQLAPMEAMEGKVETPREQLPPISALDKIIVAFAGPLFSFGLAVVFAVIVWQVGKPVSQAEAATTIGYVAPESPAAKVGLKPGDKILKVNGHKVTRFGGMSDDSIQWEIVRSEGETIPIVVERDGKSLTMNPSPALPATHFWQRDSMRQIGIVPAATPMVARVAPGSVAEAAGIQSNDLIIAIDGEKLLSVLAISDIEARHPKMTPRFTIKRGDQTLKKTLVQHGIPIETVFKNSPAAHAGIKANDIVVSVNGSPLIATMQLSDMIKKHPNDPVKLAIERKGAKPFVVSVTPQKVINAPNVQSPKIGFEWKQDFGLGITWDRMGIYKVIHPSPLEQVKSGVTTIFSTIGAIASKKSDIKLQDMSGPVMIMRVYYMMFQSPQGWRLALWFSVVLNVNLALLNLLPIPVLDGGHIVLALVEGIRRKPVNIRILEVLQTCCAILIIGFMAYIAFFDVSDWVTSGKTESLKFQQPPPSAQSR